MESTVAAAAVFNFSKNLNSRPNCLLSCRCRNFSGYIVRLALQKRLCSGRVRCISNDGNFHWSNERISTSFPAKSLRSLCTGAPITSRLACLSKSDAYSAFGGGGDGIIGGNGGGGGGGRSGDGGSDGREAKVKAVAGEAEELSVLSPDVIILDVGGMTCGGCAASVKRILEGQPLVSTANVNLATETAIVWPVPEAKATENWHLQLGESLAKHLTSCGFKSNLRGLGAIEGNNHS